MSLPRIRVTRSRFDPERPWDAPAAAEKHPLVDASDGKSARLRTEVRLFHDGVFLYVIFEFDDDLVVATMFDRDDPLYDEDVVEVFLAGGTLEEYVEVEVSPRGTLFDARVASPDRDRRSMQVDRAWNSEGLWAAVRTEGENERTRTSIVIAIPLADVATGSTAWRGNFFRIDRHPSGDSYLAWSPTGRTPPDFHVPDAFGWLDFE